MADAAVKKKGPSNVARGARYKGKTKKWLEDQGYAVAHMEKVFWIHSPRGRVPVKRDQFGADLLAMRRGDAELDARVVFVQVKFGSPSLPETVRTFKEYPFPKDPLLRVWLVVWKLRAREPQVIDVTDMVHE